MKRILIALTLGIPASLMAQDVRGTISGNLEFDPVSWSILDDAETETGWEDIEGGTRVTIVGFPAATASEDGRIELNFILEGTATQPEVIDPRVSFASQDGEVSASGENVDLSLTQAEIEGDSMVVSGNLVAALIAGGSDDLIVGSDEAVNLDANFQATIYRGGY